MDAQDQRRIGAAGILRLTSWATAATVALTLATLAGLSPAGSERIAFAFTAITGSEPRQNTQIAARKAELETDRRSMNDALRLLAADRDRLLSRVASLERNLDDITGSIKTQVPRPPPDLSLQDAPAFDPLPQIKSAETSAAITEEPSPSVGKLPNVWPHAGPGNLAVMPGSFSGSPAWPETPARLAALPAEAPMAPTVVSRTEFGVDIGSGSDLAEVRSLWNAAKSQHGKLIGNLRPIVLRREDRAGNSDYRLIVGPLANAGAAAKLCATLGAADILCSTRPYQGERLAP